MSEQIDQKVTGAVRINGQPAAGFSIKLQNGGATCGSTSLSFTTDGNGAFSGSRKADLGKLVVIVQKDKLCVLEGQAWREVWFGIYGPAPEVLSFQCNRESNMWKCTMNGLESHDRKA